MAVLYAWPESFPLLSVVYSCGCGATETRHGLHAADLPPGWVRVPRDANVEVACPGCALAAAPPAHGPV